MAVLVRASVRSRQKWTPLSVARVFEVSGVSTVAGAAATAAVERRTVALALRVW